MPQDSRWVEQAAVLRQALAEHGLTLAPPQALKVVSQLREHPTWQALGGAPGDLPASRPVGLSGGTGPLQRRAPAGGRVFVFEVRGTAPAGFVPSAEAPQLAAAWEAVRRRAAQLGFSSLEQLVVQVPPAPAAGAGQAVSVVVRLAGNNALSQLGAVPANMAALLEQLAVPACRGADGVDQVTRYAWKLVGFDKPDAG